VDTLEVASILGQIVMRFEAEEDKMLLRLQDADQEVLEELAVIGPQRCWS
jgi:hypothetical protein